LASTPKAVTKKNVSKAMSKADEFEVPELMVEYSIVMLYPFGWYAPMSSQTLKEETK
jgi:hypothetical protein